MINKRMILIGVNIAIITLFLLFLSLYLISLNKIGYLEDEVEQYRYEVIVLEKVRDRLRGDEYFAINNNSATNIDIKFTMGYPKLLINGKYYYLIDVDTSRLLLPFQQIRLGDGTVSYIISTGCQIKSDGTIWDWDKARNYKP